MPGSSNSRSRNVFSAPLRKEHVDRLEMRAGHGENMRRPIDQRRGERLAAQIADIDALLLRRRGDGVQARRLSADGVDAGGRHFDVLAIAEQTRGKGLPPSGCGKCFLYKRRGRFSQ